MYADLINLENIDTQFLAVLSPKIKITGFALFSGSTYSKSFNLGHVSGVTVDGIALVEASALPISAGEFFYDDDALVLYLRKSDSSNPASNFVVATFDIYMGTKDDHWHRDPIDTTSDSIYYEARIHQTPELKIDVSDSLFGFQPVQTSSLVMINADHVMEEFLYSASFSKARVRLYHAVKIRPTDELKVENIRLVFDGQSKDVTFQDSLVTIETVSGEDQLSSEYRNKGDSFYDSTTFPNLNPQNAGNPIRYVYGVIDGFVPINIDFVEYSSATTSDNRIWSCIGEQNNLGSQTKSVGGGTHTTTKTFLTSVSGIRIGDSVWMDRSVGADEYVLVTNVGANFIEHAALVTPMTNGDQVKRGFVGSITVIQGGTTFKPMFGRDYTDSPSLSGGCSGFTFVNNFEATLSMATLTPNDQIFCRIYGRKNDVTLGGPAFGTNDSESGNLTNPVAILLDLMKGSGITESMIDASGFSAALAARSDALGFAIPKNSTDGMPDIKTIIMEIISSCFLAVYINDNLKWTVRAVGPLGASTEQIGDDEILRKTFSGSFTYKEMISDVIVKYGYKERTDGTSNNFGVTSQVGSTSQVAKFLHGVSKSKEFDSLHFKSSDAQKMSDRYAYIFGDRLGTIKLTAKNRLFGTEVGDVLEVDRTKIPGFAYDADITRQRKLYVTSVSKTRTKVTIQTDDQKGIEDNSGAW